MNVPPPATKSHRRAFLSSRAWLWTTLTVVITLVLSTFNFVTWRNHRDAKSTLMAAEHRHAKTARQLAHVQRLESERADLVNRLNATHANVRTQLQAFRRPQMVESLCERFDGEGLSEVLIGPASPSPTHGVSFYARVPEAGQSLRVSIKTGSLDDSGDKLLSREPRTETTKIIETELAPRQLHLIQLTLSNSKDGAQLSVLKNNKVLYSDKLNSFVVQGSNYNSPASDGAFLRANVLRPHLFFDGDLRPTVEQLREGVWMPIFLGKYALRSRSQEKWRRIEIACSLKSAGPHFVPDTRHLPAQNHFEFKPATDGLREIVWRKDPLPE